MRALAWGTKLMARRRGRPPVPIATAAPTERRFIAVHPMMTANPISLFLEKGWSLRLHCFDCGREVEWTPRVLMGRFAGSYGATLGDLAPRMSCSAEGCGSRRIMLYPVNYGARDWVWPPHDGAGADVA